MLGWVMEKDHAIVDVNVNAKQPVSQVHLSHGSRLIASNTASGKRQLISAWPATSGTTSRSASGDRAR